MIQQAQKDFLQGLVDTKTLLSVYLDNGICLADCRIESFDDQVLIISNPVKGRQLVYKHSTASIVPKK